MEDSGRRTIDLETHQAEMKALIVAHQKELREQLAALRDEYARACHAFTALHKAADEEKEELVRRRETELLDGFLFDIDQLQTAHEQEKMRMATSFLGIEKEDPQMKKFVRHMRQLYRETEHLGDEQKERMKSEKKVLAVESRNAQLQRQVELLQVVLEAANFVPREDKVLREQVKQLESSNTKLTEKVQRLRDNLKHLEKASDGAIGFFKARHIDQKGEIAELTAQLEAKKETEESLRNVCAKLQANLDAMKRSWREETDTLKEAAKKRERRVKQLEKKLRVARSAMCSLRRRKEQLEHEREMLEHVDFERVRGMLEDVCGKENNPAKSIRRRRRSKKSHIHCVGIVERMLIHQAKNGAFQKDTKHNEDLLEKMYRKIEEVARNTEHLARPAGSAPEDQDENEEMKPERTP